MSRNKKEQLKLVPDIEPLPLLKGRLSPIEHQLYCEIWANTGRSISATARRLGVSIPTARKRLIRFGLYKPPVRV